jgi:hypothetical protein
LIALSRNWRAHLARVDVAVSFSCRSYEDRPQKRYG